MAFKLNKSSDNLFHKIGESKSKNPAKDPMLNVGVGKTSASALKNHGPAITPVVEEGVIPSDMTTGRSGYLDEVVISSKPKKDYKTRVEHRLDKTQIKGQEAVDDGNIKKAKRLQKRKQRLLARKAKQDVTRGKKQYVRKDKKFYRDREENA